MGENSQGTIQWGVGIICALIMAYMLYVSGGPERSYDIVAILGMLTLIAILLGHQELLVKVLQVWRGASPNTNGASSNGRNDEERSELTQQILKDIRREQQQRAREQADTRAKEKMRSEQNENEQET